MLLRFLHLKVSEPCIAFQNKGFFLTRLSFQLQQEEEELLRKRAANKTALEAIGPRKKRKLDEALESLSTAHVSIQ